MLTLPYRTRIRLAYPAQITPRILFVPPSRPSSTSVPLQNIPAKPKRPSPYRLVQPHAFLTESTPLHLAGWRLSPIPASPVRASSTDPQEITDLQDHRLVRSFDFAADKKGWRDVLAFVSRVGNLAEEEDHHPTIVIGPGGDHTPSSTSLARPESRQGYIVEISTHTHTPMPAASAPSATSSDPIWPGVTGKDLRLARKAEKAFEEMRDGQGS